MTDTNKHTQRLRTHPILPLLIRLAVPSAVAMGVNALYNLADTVFVGRGVGGDAVGAVAVSFPLQISQVGLGLIFGVGSGSLIARALGGARIQRAKKVLTISAAALFVTSLLWSGVLSLALTPLLKIFGATPDILPLAQQYGRIISLSTPLSALALMGGNTIRAEGQVNWATGALLIGATTNIGLDALLILGFKLGIAGAAIATVISQGVTIAFIAYFYLSKTSIIGLINIFTIPMKKIIRYSLRVCRIGFGSAARQIGEIIVLSVVNTILGRIGGSIAISAYGIVHRIVLFSLLPLIGIAQGLLPIVGYNWGARQYDRTYKALALGNRLTLIIGSIIAVLEILFAEYLMGLFITDPEIVQIGAQALRIMAFSIPLIPMQLNAAIFHQAIDRGGTTLFIHLLRQLMLITPLALLLGWLFGLVGIWSSFLIGDILATGIVLLLPTSRKRVKTPVPLSSA